jgi:mannose-6-phosphate isomerase-like protein (cupin superfamily)
MELFQLSQFISGQDQRDVRYQEFLRKDSLSVGVYTLRAGAVDPQKPHTEDEVYYIVSGRGCIKVGDEDRDVMPGTTVFVAAGVEHRFHTIRENLTILVFFAPAENASKG